MKRIIIAVACVLVVGGLPGVARADLNAFIQKLNVQAKADIGKYTVQVGAQFGVPQEQVTAIIKKTDSPADAFMVLQLGQMSKKDPETVVRTYQGNKGKGWGAIAKELGIKPGSPEFHALKRGDFSLTGQPTGGTGKGKGKGHGKAQDKGPGKGQGKHGKGWLEED
jgi:hypothetical protein